MYNRTNFLETPIDNLTMAETIDIIDNSIVEKKPVKHTVINVAKLINMKFDKNLYNSVVTSDIINADGKGILLGAKFLNQPFKERVTGIDLMENLVKLSFEKGYKCFFQKKRLFLKL